MKSNAYGLTSMAFPKNDSPSTSPLEWDGAEVSDNDSTAGDSDAAKLARR